MKPLKLTMRAFGSYSRETVIDFTKPSQNLFLVTGDTGAGKTTVFDAIVFALYGEASSVANKKEGMVLQSQYASYDVTPFVKLEFSDGENGDVYTVLRIPRHQKLITRGQGSGVRTTEKNASVSLIMPDGTEYPAKETARKIEEIAGFNKEQFMQVAMIAQGEFMELLRANSDTKKVIFRKLFHTDFYEKIVQELEMRKRAKEKEIAEIRTGCRTIVPRIKIPEDYEKAEQISRLKARMEEGALGNMEQFLEELAALCEYCRMAKEEASLEYEEASFVRDEKRDAYTAAKDLLKFYSQLEQAEADLAECENRREEMERARKLADSLSDAYDILTEYKAYKTAEKAADNIRQAKQKKEEILPLLTEEAAKLAKREKEEKVKYDARQVSYNKLSERVEAARKIFTEIEAVKTEYEAGLENLETAQKKEREEKGKFQALEAQETIWNIQAKELGNAETLLEKWRLKEREAKDLHEASEEVKELKEQITEWSGMAANERKVYEEAKTAYLQANTGYEQKRQNFLDAQAGILAGSLEKGKPCPVCGSLEHPAPCRHESTEENFSKEQIENLREAVEMLREEQEKAADRAKEKEISLREKISFYEEKLQKLIGDYQKAVSEKPEERDGEFEGRGKETVWGDSETNEDFIFDHIKKFQEKVEAEGVFLQENAENLKGILKKLEDAKTEKEALRRVIEQYAENSRAAENAVHKSQVRMESLSGTTEFAGTEEADSLLREEESRRDEANRCYQEIKERAGQAESEKKKAETLLQNYREELPEKEAEAREKRAAYENRMAEKDLSETEWKELTTGYEKEDIEKIRREITAYRLKEQTALAVRKTAKEAIEQKEKPVLEKLEEEKIQAETKLAENKEKLEHCRERERDNVSVYEELAPKAKEREIVIEEHARLENLYRLASGNVTGRRMDLETFVQRYYLEKVLHAANRRFLEMSAGQFELRMVSPERAGEGKNRGLDLMVYSAVTGKEREIRTLSGGESFIAALSLALGMADQIQENTSAIHLDIMFIDEGFGSLDEHSRNQAVKVLKMMAEGKRLIGIISHVTELKQEIEDKLIVTKNDEGSSVRWE